MSILNQLNEAFQAQFNKERLRLVTTWDVKKVEAIERLRIENVMWKSELTEDGDYIVDFGENASYFESDKRIFEVYQEEGPCIQFTYSEWNLIRSWLEAIELPDYIWKIRDEKTEKRYTHMKKTSETVRIETILSVPGQVIYVLSNGEKIIEKIE